VRRPMRRIGKRREEYFAVAQLPRRTPNFFTPLTRRIPAAKSALRRTQSAASYASRRTAPRRRSTVPRYKGKAENALLAAGFPRLYIFRPAYIYPVEPRKEPNFSYRLLRAIYPAFRSLFSNQVIRADDLARAMVDVARRGSGERGGQIFENYDIRAMVESLHTHE
jgi:uncharacterized protein YbjT (DUF2867 family)